MMENADTVAWNGCKVRQTGVPSPTLTGAPPPRVQAGPVRPLHPLPLLHRRLIART
jgi:hypothetical protein